MLVSETKIDDCFPQGQFVIDGFCAPYRLDHNCLGGGSIEEKPIESFYVELNLRISKWLVNCSYNPHKNSIGNHLHRISESLDLLSFDYEKMIFLGDFNVTDDEHHMKSFCKSYGLENLIRQPTCYKNPSNPVCIDLILTNVPGSFQITCVVETGLSDFHLMTFTVMRKSFKHYQPKTINYM